MSRWSLTALAALLALGCDGGKKQNPDAGDVANAPVDVAAPIAEPAPPPPVDRATPTALYDQCHDRLELPEAAGECTTDADCGSVGCGKEVCTTTKAGAEVMSTCEDRPCFKVLDACGCHDGKCTWTLKAEAPAAAPLPASLPPTTGMPSGDAPAPAPVPPAPADAPKP